MEDRTGIILACENSELVRHLIQILADVEASNHSSPIIVVQTKEEAREISMFHQPWPLGVPLEISSRELRYYEDFRTMMSDGQDGAFAQSAFVNELALKQEKKNRKNNNRVQFKNEAYKFYNRKRSR